MRERQFEAHRQTSLSDRQAVAIYQAHIDHLTTCLVTGDFERFATRIHLPHHISNISTAFVSRNKDDLRNLFEQVRERLTADGVDQFIRIATGARFESETVLIGEHKSEMLRGTVRAIAPFDNRLRLVQTADGVWKETHSANAVSLKGRNIGLYVSSEEAQDIPEFSSPPEG